ncbi:hypothetical protein BJ875DRAFT_346964, partial [Amylocarpus encephaloides]
MSLPTRTISRTRPQLHASSPCKHLISQKRKATLLHRPQRPYTFTQLITLSDGSTYLSRTTSPAPVYRSTKDTRNHALWQPSNSSLKNVEQDEAGRLRAFRDKFGRGWDLDSAGEEKGEAGQQAELQEDSLMDLISGAA